MALRREVRARGFAGTHRQVRRFVAERRTVPARRTAHTGLGRVLPAGIGAGTAPPPPSPKQLAWPLVRPVAALSSCDAAAVARVEQDAEAARRFTALVRHRGVGRDERHPAPRDAFDAWSAEARTCGVRAVETFAAGLEQDGVAVRAALPTPWSNGQTEVRIARLELIKRTMYGRAGLDLLRRRVLLAA